MSNNNTANNGTNDPSKSRLDSSLEADITQLNSFLLNGSLDHSNETDDLMEALARLESADGIARGVEGRLDELLGTLDDLLTSLEACDEKKTPENERTIAVEVERVEVIPTERDRSDLL